MSEEMDDWKKKMRAIREANAEMLAKLEGIKLLQCKFDQIQPIESLSNKHDQNQFNGLFLRMLDQQNQFHERLLSKLDEIVNALKK
jgi:hypothetical protein